MAFNIFFIHKPLEQTLKIFFFQHKLTVNLLISKNRNRPPAQAFNEPLLNQAHKYVSFSLYIILFSS